MMANFSNTALLTFNPSATFSLPRARFQKIAIATGPEVVLGSTRLKAGTATKMVLNMLTTGAMIRLGKTYGNLMVDLRATNSKLVVRARRLVARLARVSEDEAERLLAAADGELKTAVVSRLRAVSPAEARRLLAAEKEIGRAHV